MTPHLSVIIVSWNTRELLARCLESVLAEADGLAAEVLVVDNASSDGSCELVRERFASSVRLIANTRNVGFAPANNQAIAVSSGRYVALLNPDTEVQPGALGTLVRFLEEHPETGAAGARLVNPDGSLQPSCFPAPTLSRELWRLLHLDVIWPYGSYRMADWSTVSPRQVDVAQGTCLVLPRAVLDQVGALDEDYFIYSEEVDLCHRLREQGFRIVWVPRAGVMHHGGQSTRQVAAAMFLRLYQAKVLYFRKRHGRLTADVYKLVLLVAAMARLMLTPVVWLKSASERRRELTLARHYLQLVRALPSL